MSVIGELVAESRHGQDVPRVGRVWLEFLPQVRDVQADIVVLLAVFVTPHLTQQRLGWHQPTWIGRQVVQQPVLSRREMHGLTMSVFPHELAAPMWSRPGLQNELETQTASMTD